jgi:hypothetical protein
MTAEESAYAYDLGDMYSIIPTTFSTGLYENIYKRYKPADVKIYASYNQEPISKEDLRKLILEENLI